MELILKQYDIPLLRFSATNDSSTPEIEVHWINEDQRHLLPLDMELSPEGPAAGCAAAPSPATAPTSIDFWQNAD
mgnify:CR=1 FL=1